MLKKSLVFTLKLYKMTVFFQKKIDIFTFCLDNKKKKIFREVCVLTVGTACTKLYFSVQKGTISKMVPFFNI